MKKYRRTFFLMMIFILLFPDTNLVSASIKAKNKVVDISDGWDFNVFGSNISEDKNPAPVINKDDSVTLEAKGGKISSTVDGISFYHKRISASTNFEIRTKATVQTFGANNQVSFGIMLRDEVGEHKSSSGHESNYIAIGALDQTIKGFYKQDSQMKLEAFDNNIPSEGSVYELSIKKSGNTYALSINGGYYETITLEEIFTEDMFVGIYSARDTTVTFSDTEIEEDNKAVENLTVDSAEMKKEYLTGESLDLAGLQVIAEFTGNDSQVLAEDDYIVTGFDSSEVGINYITINYNGKTAIVELAIIDLTVTDLEIKYYPAQTNYYKGDRFDALGLVVLAEFNNGYKISELEESEYSVTIEGDELEEEDYILNESGEISVTITSQGKSVIFNVFVYEEELVGLEVKKQPSQTLYFVGDKLKLEGISVYAIYSNNTEVRLMSDEYAVSGFDSQKEGEKELTITHKGKKTTIPVTVKTKEVQKMEVTSYPKTTYRIGEDFDHDGLVISKVYDNKDKETLDDEDYKIDTTDFDHDTPGTYTIKIDINDASLDPITFKVTVREQADVEWRKVRFGQSSSENNNYIEILDDVVKVVALEGGGKVTGDHDGITYYYTEVDAEADNFTLSADIYVDEYAKIPHDGQESFGIMARDILGSDGDSSVIASNIAAIGGYSGGTGETNGTQLFTRTGVFSPDGEGSQGIQKVMLDSVRPNSNNTSENYRLTLTKTNSGFTGKINDGEEAIIYEPDILSVQDGKMFVGFYTARYATIEVSNIDFMITAAETDAPKELPPVEAVTPSLDILSLDKTSKEDYTLVLKPNVSGSVTVKQGQEMIRENISVKAGEAKEILTEINANQMTNFSVIFLPDDTQYLTDYKKIVQNFTVTMKTFKENGNIYVSPEGTVNGTGSEDKPLDLDTAIQFVKEGQKIIVLEGHYVRDSKLEIKRFNDGTIGAMKYMIADPNAKERPLIDFDKKGAGVVHSGNYWYIKGIDFARSAGDKKGYTIGGSYNTIENIRTYNNGDTGLQISRTDVTQSDKSKWPSHNLILNSISFDNRDPSDNNADGFAAKLTSGEGNIFRGTVAYNNIDDGWDLYTKVGTGEIGEVLIEDSIAFNNGWVSYDTDSKGDGNGFKLGGEGVHVPHIIKNSLAFNNDTYGFTSNSNPGVIAEKNISINNGTNLGFTTYTGIDPDFTIDGFVSIQEGNTEDNYLLELESDKNYLFNGLKSINKSGQELSSESSNEMSSILTKLFNYDNSGNILSVKENQWKKLWETYDKVTDFEEVEESDKEDKESEGQEGGNSGIENEELADSNKEPGANSSELDDNDDGSATKNNELSNSVGLVQDNDQGGDKRLPNTATSIYNILIFGFFSLMIGAIFIFLQRKLTKNKY